MSWIILALTLGASITSIIHGVFMLFGSLSVSSSAVFGIPNTLLASLPIISAAIALIGGVIAFNQSKWGALFLFIAMGLCVPARDTWLYGGLYFFAGLFCFFLKSKKNDDVYYDYDDENLTADEDSADQDFYYEPVIPQPILNNDTPGEEPPSENEDPLSDNVSANEALQLNAETPKIRAHRMTKSCPECGAIVSRESRFCPTCGAKLSVILNQDGDFKISGRDDDIDIGKLNDQLLTPMSSDDINDVQEQLPDETQSEDTQEDTGMLNIDTNDGDDMANAQSANYRLVRPGRAAAADSTAQRASSRRTPSGSEAASSYKEFSRVAIKGKKRSRSFGRRVVSALVLIAAVGGALYFLLGLRKLPPGELPPIPGTETVIEAEKQLPIVPDPVVQEKPKQISTSEPTAIAVAENLLPNFTPEREPRNGIITGSSVNVRADHTTSSSRVTRLNVNSKVNILGTFNVTSGKFSGIWYNIRTGNHEGWVYGKYVRPVGSGLPSGYSNALLKSFGGNKAQLIEALGNPTRSTGSSAEWPGLTATLKGDDVTKIRITSNSRELQNGLKPGMSETALLQIMGYPSSQNGRNMNYNEGGKTGLTVQLDKNNAITSITVNEI